MRREMSFRSVLTCPARRAARMYSDALREYSSALSLLSAVRPLLSFASSFNLQQWKRATLAGGRSGAAVRLQMLLSRTGGETHVEAWCRLISASSGSFIRLDSNCRAARPCAAPTSEGSSWGSGPVLAAAATASGACSASMSPTRSDGGGRTALVLHVNATTAMR